MKIEEAFYNIAQKTNKKVIKILGKGAAGVACLLSDNTVLKFTVDKSEAFNSKQVIGKKTKHLNKIYAVYELISDEKIENDNDSDEYWIIFQDFIETIFLDIEKISEKKLVKIEKELNKFGIYETDFHSSNFGIKDSKIIHFDFGKGEYPEKETFNYFKI